MESGTGLMETTRPIRVSEELQAAPAAPGRESTKGKVARKGGPRAIRKSGGSGLGIWLGHHHQRPSGCIESEPEGDGRLLSDQHSIPPSSFQRQENPFADECALKPSLICVLLCLHPFLSRVSASSYCALDGTN